MQEISRIRKMMAISMLAAISFLLLFIDFPVLPGFPFLKVDFGNVPILIGTVLFGPFGGIATAGVAGLLDVLIRDSSPVGMIGVLANWIAAVAYITPIYGMLKQTVNQPVKAQVKRMVVGIILGTILMTAVMAVTNLFVLLPLYMNLISFKISVTTFNMVLYGIIPFNFIKGSIVGIVIGVLYFRLMPIVKRNIN